MSKQPRIAVLFVCLGNICRSPLAEGIFREVVRQAGAAAMFDVDSAGTGAWHVGSPPDPRSIAIAARYGIDISGQRARRIEVHDFNRFDLLLGMDRSNVDALSSMAPAPRAGRVRLFGTFATGRAFEVPDPYYDGADGFERVYRMVRDASEKLAEKLMRVSDPASGHASSIT